MPISHTIRQLKIALVALQGFQVLFLWLHDWVPLGSLNDIAAVRSADSKQRLIVVTLTKRSVHRGSALQPVGLRTILSALALHLALDQLWTTLARADTCLVDTLSDPG